jgi:hypothetical protein
MVSCKFQSYALQLATSTPNLVGVTSQVMCASTTSVTPAVHLTPGAAASTFHFHHAHPRRFLSVVNTRRVAHSHMYYRFTPYLSCLLLAG